MRLLKQVGLQILPITSWQLVRWDVAGRIKHLSRTLHEPDLLLLMNAFSGRWSHFTAR